MIFGTCHSPSLVVVVVLDALAVLGGEYLVAELDDGRSLVGTPLPAGCVAIVAIALALARAEAITNWMCIIVGT